SDMMAASMRVIKMGFILTTDDTQFFQSFVDDASGRHRQLFESCSRPANFHCLLLGLEDKVVNLLLFRREFPISRDRSRDVSGIAMVLGAKVHEHQFVSSNVRLVVFNVV